MSKEYTPENITHLEPDDIFVFGSNLEGMLYNVRLPKSFADIIEHNRKAKIKQ